MIRNIMKDQVFLSLPSTDAIILDLGYGKDLLDTLKFYQATCVGMAANMIGIRKNIIAINLDENYILMYNPKIIRLYGKKYQCFESCLSLDGERKATRYEKIQVEYFNEEFKKITKTFQDFSAQIILHECDHLQGVII